MCAEARYLYGGARGSGNIMPRLAGALSHKAGKKPSLKNKNKPGK
jgi:hypothetical protein